MGVDTLQWVGWFMIALGSAWQGVCLFAVAKRLDLHIKRKGHDGRN